ncbi:MAG: LacI family DNA-binding transcriptional regulator [Ignavibacteriaceae bacterium]|nr:LacI family DNA-binding transcriptional regulator [Ignavibacteriaceae bacterium]
MSTNVCAKTKKTMAITLEKISEVTGFSVSTVSRVLNKKSKKYRISLETERIIYAKAKELGYKPNELARGLRLKKTHTIGLVVPDISNPFFASITHLIQKYLYEEGYSLIVCNTNEDIKTEIEQIDLMRRKGVDGYIIMPVGTQFEHIKDLLDDDKPLVLLDRNIDALNANCIVVDNYRGAYEATECLVRYGHERIAIIQGLQNTYTNNERVRGYKDALADNGIRIDESYIVGNDFRRENGYISTKMLLKMENPPTAIFAFSDLITLGMLQAISEEKVRIPDDVSIISFDEIDFAPYLFSPLTVVVQPRELIGEAAVKLLIEEMRSKNRSGKRKILLESKLVIRESIKNFNLGITAHRTAS